MKIGCSNINWVSPTPHLPFAVKALALAVEKGLSIPVVYNTNGYINIDILKKLDGIIDIYLPDCKYGDDSEAETYSVLPGYFSVSIQAVREMVRQTGILQFDTKGAAVSGVLVRHLIMPRNVAGSAKIFSALAEINPDIHISLMSQYQPRFRALHHEVIGRKITKPEFIAAWEAFRSSGLHNGYFQFPDDFTESDPYFPDFNRPDPDIFSAKSSM